MAYINSIYNCGNDYPQYIVSTGRRPSPGPKPVPPVPPEPVPPGPIPPVPPIPKVCVSISINDVLLTINASGDIGDITGYYINFYNGDLLVKQYMADKNITTYNLTTAGKELQVQYYNIDVCPFVDKTQLDKSNMLEWYNTVPLPACEPMTLRFRFSKNDFAPVDENTNESITTKGTWTKVDADNENIWDWTYDDPDWSSAFQGVFADEENEVSVIAAGDTSSVTSTKTMFAGQYSGTWPNHMSLAERNNITSCVPLDLSSCTDVSLMFYGSSLNNAVPIKFNSNPVVFYGMFADTLIREIKEYDFGGVENLSGEDLGIFAFDSLLTKVGCITGTENFSRCDIFPKCPELEVVDYISPFLNATRGDTQFSDCRNLKRLNYVIEMPKATRIDSCFANCNLLEYIGGFICGEGIVTNAAGYINACRQIKDNVLPLFDTSATTNFDHLMQGCRLIETIPDLDVSSVTNVNMAFRSMRNAKFGILEMYQKLSARGAAITNHNKCFENCGIDTEEGQAALAQIPTSWGGLKEE